MLGLFDGAEVGVRGGRVGRGVAEATFVPLTCVGVTPPISTRKTNVAVASAAWVVCSARSISAGCAVGWGGGSSGAQPTKVTIRRSAKNGDIHMNLGTREIFLMGFPLPVALN